jgi:hypothetical protein
MNRIKTFFETRTRGLKARMIVRPITQQAKKQQKELHQTVQITKDIEALHALLVGTRGIPNALILRAVEVIRNKLLKHPQVHNYFLDFEAVDKLTRTYEGRITQRDAETITVEFAVNGTTEVRQFPFTSAPWLANLTIGQRVSTRCVLEPLTHGEPLNSNEKRTFRACVRKIESLWQAGLQKAKPFSDAK